MANLIIKSSADNLVLQGSDASPAITVGATGTTTFAENVTLSGTANNLGTVATGNISNTSIVYPAGHIVQTVVHQNSLTATQSGTSFATGTKVTMGTITPQYANSDILITGHASVNADANAAYVFADIYKNASDFTETANLSGHSYGLIHMNDACIWVTCPIHWLDTCSENSTSEKTYGFSVRANSSGGNVTVGWGANGGNVMILQEIKR